MLRFTALSLPIVAIAAAAAITPATAQRDVILAHDYNFAAEDLKKESALLADLDKQISQATDLVKGCGLLRQKVTHLTRADELLTQMVESAHQLKRRKEKEGAEKQQKDIRTSLEVTNGDIGKMCESVPA